MKHIQPAVETEYDFVLHYNHPPVPFIKPNDPVASGVKDDNGKVVVFEGDAIVVLVESNSFSGTDVYVRIFQPIKLVDGKLRDDKYEYEIIP
jgi:hypothetical protein